ncbi:uncharacterized protein EI97DRAFT_127334 [Westerdykella ornata]|uniref:Uncharacterized protein n=1 Tax=Westerdykella ornata TaxID=318751 RepID=A0A6A6JDM0_WESOR|nr:uncharacterized protein EI97DRAFT_127334 [Westerdykella ornata]KAF2274365.1 hypothetical protein EI97DRAFT_127334 [Westerdykella ornata]
MCVREPWDIVHMVGRMHIVQLEELSSSREWRSHVLPGYLQPRTRSMLWNLSNASPLRCFLGRRVGTLADSNGLLRVPGRLVSHPHLVCNGGSNQRQSGLCQQRYVTCANVGSAYVLFSPWPDFDCDGYIPPATKRRFVSLHTLPVLARGIASAELPFFLMGAMVSRRFDGCRCDSVIQTLDGISWCHVIGQSPGSKVRRGRQCERGFEDNAR